MFNQCPICYNETTIVYEERGQKLCPHCYILQEFAGDFDESLHPRDEQGQWTDAGREGEGGGGRNTKEISDITSEFNVSRESLLRDSQKIVVDGQDVYIGKAGYFSIGGGHHEIFDGRIVSGPKEFIGKEAYQIPEVSNAIDVQLNTLNDKVKNGTGNFAFVGTSNGDDLISKATYLYKTEITRTRGQDIINKLTEAYRNNSQVQTLGVKDVDVNFNKEKIMFEKYLVEHPDSESIKEYLSTIDKRRFTEKTRAISDLEHKSDMTGQSMVNQFSNEVRITQTDLQKRYPGGTVTLYRGVQGQYAKDIKNGVKKNSNIEITVNTTSSWTSNVDVAKQFAPKGVVIKKEISIKDILFSYYTTPYIRTSDYMFGGTEEHEFVIGSDKTISLSREDIINE